MWEKAYTGVGGQGGDTGPLGDTVWMEVSVWWSSVRLLKGAGGQIWAKPSIRQLALSETLGENICFLPLEKTL